MERKASAVWQGKLRDGKGTITTNSRALSSVDYSFATRFENHIGTNPEELIAAAHAACFSMALAAQLEKAGMNPERISTTGTVTVERSGSEWKVTLAHLDTFAYVPGAERRVFEKLADEAKSGCPISRLLNAKITLTATLDAGHAEDHKIAG